jgi:DNA polymerase-1
MAIKDLIGANIIHIMTVKFYLRGTILYMAKPKLLCIDGTNILYRSYHALAGTKMEHAGRPIWAVHGFIMQLAKLIANNEFTHILVAVDTQGGCQWRRDLYPDYKVHRSAPNEDLAYQLSWAPNALRQCGINVVEYPGWEADDVIASAVNIGEASGYECLVFSSDRDCIQLVSNMTTVLTPDGKEIDLKFVLDTYGCEPLGYRGIAAMRGEPSDNLPGITGIGAITAKKLIAKFLTFEGILNATDEELSTVVGPKIIATIRSQADQARTTYKTAKLDRDLVIDIEAGKVATLSASSIKTTLTSLGLPSAGTRLSGVLDKN